MADLTGRNANVFYEVGYAHAKNKPCILLTQSAEDIPFDLKHHRHIVYGRSLSDLRSMLTEEKLDSVKGQLESYENAFEVRLETYGRIVWDAEISDSMRDPQAKARAGIELHLVINLCNRHDEQIEVI